MQEEIISKSLETMMWLNIYVCYPLTLFVIGMCCAVRMDRVPITYYINLLALNLIQSVGLILYKANEYKYHLHFIFLAICNYGVMGSLYFRMIIALERCLFICRPQLLVIRQTKGSVIICILVWVFCAVVFPLGMIFGQLIFFIVALALPGLIFIICLVQTLRSLCAATSVSTEEKHRIVATLLLLLISYTVMDLSLVFIHFFGDFDLLSRLLCLFLLRPFMDLILFVVMRKGFIDKLLTGLCCCRMQNTAGSDSSRGTCEAQTDQPTDRKKESQEEESKM